MQSNLLRSLIVSGALAAAVIGQAARADTTDSLLVDLSDQGEAQFSGKVSALPEVCFTEPDVAFLIRVGAGKWIANATVLR